MDEARRALSVPRVLEIFGAAALLVLLTPLTADAHAADSLPVLAGSAGGVAVCVTGLVIWRSLRSSPPISRGRVLLRSAIAFIASLIVGWLFLAPAAYLVFFG